MKILRSKNLFAVLFLAASIFFSAFSSFPASASSVTINGKALSEVQDVIKEATGSEYQELPKHSLLLYEQRSNGSGTAARSIVFTISTSGARLKQHILPDKVQDSTPLSGRANVVQRMNLSVSAKRFGMRRNLMHTIAGHSYLGTDYLSVYGVDTIRTESSDQNAQISNSYADTQRTSNRCNIWGNAHMTIKGMEDRDVFVYAVTDVMGMSGSLRVGFITGSRNETSGGSGGAHVDIVNQDSNMEFKLFNYDNGIHGVCIGAGDIDGDGYKNEFAVGFHDNGQAWVYIYSVTNSGSRLAVSRIYAILIHDGDDANSDMGYRQACPNIVVGDFDGDGYDEAAFVGRTYESDMRVGIIKYSKDTKKWSYDNSSFTQTQTACIATRADLDGDGKDEIVGLFFPERSAGVAHPRLERWYCDKGTIKPKRDKNAMKGGPGDTSVFGYAVNFTNGRYLIAEDFSITAGPLTGTYGKAKLVDDIAISHVDNSGSRVFVIPTQIDKDKNFSKFGDRQNIYNDSTANTGRKGALITGDFANESLMLGQPQKTVDKHDQSFIETRRKTPCFSYGDIRRNVV